MDENSLVSIILPTHNGSRYIKQSIDSCLGQTYKNLELIIVDDYSSDNTENIIKSYFDSRIKYFKHEKKMGLSESLNTGFRNSKGDYLTWTSDDNFYSPEAISTMMGALYRDPKINFVYSNYYIINETGKSIKRLRVPPPRIIERYNCVGACFMYRRRVYEQVGGYDSDFYLAEDYEYWLRIKSRFKIKRLNKFLYYYRFHKDSLTFTYERVKVEEQVMKANNKYISLPSIKYYHKGKLLFYKKDYIGAGKFLISSLMCDPINLDTWKLLIFIFIAILSPAIAEKIKKYD